MSSPKAITTLAESAVYMSPGGEIQLDVPLDSDTVWLTQEQMAKLFGSSQRMMSYHINNVFADKELDWKSNIQKMYIAGSDKPIALHSLDVIISVGYRVKSAEGVHFRRWATAILRERLLKAHRQRQTDHGRMKTLGTLATHVLNDQEARALLNVIGRYASSWQMLRQYDQNALPEQPASPTRRMKRLTLKQAQAAIEALVIKDHPFIDGNKRIGSLLFVHYLEKNGWLTHPDGSQRFDPNALVAIALLVAESNPRQKDVVIRLILAMLSS